MKFNSQKMYDEKLSEIVQLLCDLDNDRLIRNVDYKLNLQSI